MARADIEFYRRFYDPIDISTLKFELIGPDFVTEISLEDREKIKAEWEKVVQESGGKAFSRPRSLGTLYDTTNDTIKVRATEFMDYVGISRSSDDQRLNPKLYDLMKVCAVGAAVRTTNGFTFVHRRSEQATHSKGYWDSSVAGFAHIDETGVPNFSKYIREKLFREVRIKEEEIKSMKVTAIHSSGAPDFSGMVDFLIDVNLESDQIRERIPEGQWPEFIFLQESQVADFVREHFLYQRDMIGDGAATLLASLNHMKFGAYISDINIRGRSIKFGNLKNGIFRSYH